MKLIKLMAYYLESLLLIIILRLKGPSSDGLNLNSSTRSRSSSSTSAMEEGQERTLIENSEVNWEVRVQFN